MSAGKGKRIKKAHGVLRTREDVERCVGEIARLTIERDALTAEMDERLRAVREQFEGRLGDLALDLEVEIDMAKDWAQSNPTEFAGRKSIELVHGTIGFRTGMPRLRARRGLSWAGVLDLLRAAGREEYIRTKTEPDKEKLLADRERLGEDGLAKMGVSVAQDETFFVEPKRETADGATVRKEAAA